MTLTVDRWTAGDVDVVAACATVPWGAGAAWADLARDLTAREREHAAARLPKLDRAAGRVAAKRALLAARAAVSDTASDVVVEVLAAGGGQPIVRWSEGALPGQASTLVSVSHDGEVAVALAVVTVPATA